MSCVKPKHGITELLLCNHSHSAAHAAYAIASLPVCITNAVIYVSSLLDTNMQQLKKQLLP